MAASSKGIDVAHIAALARLRLSPEAAAKLAGEMENIVGYVEMLSELDVSGIEPTAHAVPRSNVIRDAVPTARKRLRIETRKEIFAYLESLPLNIDLTVNDVRYKLVHGGPVEEYPEWHPDYPDETFYAVWKRWSKYEQPSDDYTMIFGHTPTDHYQLGHILRIWYGERLIGLDCGSGFPEGPDPWDHHQGRLACLRLDDMQEFYSSEDPPPAA